MQFYAPVPKLAVIKFASGKPDLHFANIDAALKWARIHGDSEYFKIEEFMPITEEQVE